jgi:hypothetical protein
MRGTLDMTIEAPFFYSDNPNVNNDPDIIERNKVLESFVPPQGYLFSAVVELSQTYEKHDDIELPFLCRPDGSETQNALQALEAAVEGALAIIVRDEDAITDEELDKIIAVRVMYRKAQTKKYFSVNE